MIKIFNLSLYLISTLFLSNQYFAKPDLYLYTKLKSSSSIEEFKLDSSNIISKINHLKSNNYLCWIKKDDCTSYFIIHGFFEYYRETWVQKMMKELFNRHESGLINVYAVDWAAGEYTNFFSNIQYFPIVKNMPKTAFELQKLTVSLLDLNYMQENFNTVRLHCIGHSLGAHICGFLGKGFIQSKGVKLRRITGLDPAGPEFNSKSDEKKLFKSDAHFVDIIHTNKGKFLPKLGIDEQIGHADFYVNGGSQQPDCKNNNC